MISENAIRIVADAKIEQAIEDGKFLKLTGFGRPFEGDFLNPDPNWWIKKKCKIESLKTVIQNGQHLLKVSNNDNA